MKVISDAHKTGGAAGGGGGSGVASGPTGTGPRADARLPDEFNVSLLSLYADADT